MSDVREDLDSLKEINTQIVMLLPKLRNDLTLKLSLELHLVKHPPQNQTNTRTQKNPTLTQKKIQHTHKKTNPHTTKPKQQKTKCHSWHRVILSVTTRIHSKLFHLQFRKPFSLPLKLYINTLLIVYRSKQRLKLSYLLLSLHIQLKYMLNSIFE